MQCQYCGSPVIWKGPISALTHTECQQCGAVNSQLVQPVEDEESEDYPPH